jgi:hypothetical protein
LSGVTVKAGRCPLFRHSGESRNPVPLNSHIPYVVNSSN